MPRIVDVVFVRCPSDQAVSDVYKRCTNEYFASDAHVHVMHSSEIQHAVAKANIHDTDTRLLIACDIGLFWRMMSAIREISNDKGDTMYSVEYDPCTTDTALHVTFRVHGDVSHE